MFRKIVSASLVAATLAGASLTMTTAAEARGGRNGAFAAGAAIGLLGGALLASPGYAQPAYYDEPVYSYRPVRRCWTERRFVDDYYGGHYRRVRVCN